MKIINVNLQELKEYNLTPNQYVLLKCIKSNSLNLITWDYSKDYEILQTNGYISFNNTKQLASNKNFDFNVFIIEWMKLWPTFELPGGYRVSGNSLEVKKRMKKFFINHPEYNDDIILKATSNYLNNKKLHNWAYTKKNSKFIYDVDGSMLEQECQAIVSGEEKARSNIIDM